MGCLDPRPTFLPDFTLVVVFLGTSRTGAISTTEEHPFLIGIPVAAVPISIPSQAEGYSCLEAVRGLRAGQPRDGMCPLLTSASATLVFNLL